MRKCVYMMLWKEREKKSKRERLTKEEWVKQWIRTDLDSLVKEKGQIKDKSKFRSKSGKGRILVSEWTQCHMDPAEKLADTFL